MAKDEDKGEDADRALWEDVIDDVRKKAGETFDHDSPEIRKEKSQMIDRLKKGYRDRLGDPYSDEVRPQ